jgi:hypothetical protein
LSITMNKHGLMFALAFCLWLWQYIAMRRLTLKKLGDRENNKKIRERFDILQERLKSKANSVEKKGWKITSPEIKGGFSLEIRNSPKNAYHYRTIKLKEYPQKPFSIFSWNIRNKEIDGFPIQKRKLLMKE